MKQIVALLESAVRTAFDQSVNIQLTRPDEAFGDYATNVALQLAKQVGKAPRDVAAAIITAMPENNMIEHIDIAGPGFINLRLSDGALVALVNQEPAQPLEHKVVVVEYSDPNPFKVLHAGHLYTSVVGDAMASLLQQAGAAVHRVNFGGDVGLHVGKTMYVILQRLGGENPEKLADIPADKRSEWMAECYVEGTNAYEDSEEVKTAIIALNKKVYDVHAHNDHDSAFAQIYWTCRQWSYDYFDQFYARIGTKFEKYYPESQTAPVGLRTVREQLQKGVYSESDGAIIFDGEQHGLHTRVFINREGLPTYEAKDVGLIILKKQDYDFDVSVVITANEQEQYMAVVLKSIEQFAPELAQNTRHLTHGIVKLAGGVKMSSRKGNILRAVDVLDVAAKANQQITGNSDDQVTLGAVKYAFLKQRTGGDIIYDPAESVSLQGNSGPYLQYAHARARSILAKAANSTADLATVSLEAGERALVRKLGEYAEVVDNAVDELMPHYICTYLYELAQVFNRFYENNRVIGDEREGVRLALVAQYAQILKNGLTLLNIPAPDHM